MHLVPKALCDELHLGVAGSGAIALLLLRIPAARHPRRDPLKRSVQVVKTSPTRRCWAQLASTFQDPTTRGGIRRHRQASIRGRAPLKTGFHILGQRYVHGGEVVRRFLGKAFLPRPRRPRVSHRRRRRRSGRVPLPLPERGGTRTLCTEATSPSPLARCSG
jgi:hypothetical protein